MVKDSNKKFISYALRLARKNLGITSPNPVVGCVIVKDNKIISSGVTAKNGRPHAEKIAIEKISDKKILQGAEIYVTLEPCSHFGQTAPCVDEIIKYKFKKVVIATQDPDQRVNGAAIQKLRQASIEVVYGVLEKDALEINRGFFKARQIGLPFVTLKLATSLDGKIATKNFASKWISSKEARLFSHNLRAVNDAILVGANTIKKDDPTLDCRILGLENYSPKRVIISNNLDFNLSAKVFSNIQEIPTIILTADSTTLAAKKLKNLNAELIFCSQENGKINLQDALKKLCLSGVNSLLVEGGRNIATQFLQENLVDELVWIRSTKIIGDDGISAVDKMGFLSIDEVLNNFKKTEIKEFPEDLIEVYRRKS